MKRKTFPTIFRRICQEKNYNKIPSDFDCRKKPYNNLYFTDEEMIRYCVHFGKNWTFEDLWIALTKIQSLYFRFHFYGILKNILKTFIEKQIDISYKQFYFLYKFSKYLNEEITPEEILTLSNNFSLLEKTPTDAFAEVLFLKNWKLFKDKKYELNELLRMLSNLKKIQCLI